MPSEKEMPRTSIKNLSLKKGEEVLILGWISVRRDQGKMIFLDIRDTTDIIQCVILPGETEALQIGKILRSEFVVEVSGKVNERPEKNKKTGVVNGDIELEIRNIRILNESETLPFPIDGDTRIIDEAVRIEYRYLDLRNPRMQKNIRARARIQKFIRDFLTAENFTEVETPLLSAPTPEGSRSFVVPSRIWKGDFYSLPQAPQNQVRAEYVQSSFQFGHHYNP